MGPVGEILGDGAPLADVTATDAMAFGPAPTPPFSTDALDAFAPDFFFSQYVSAQPPAVSSPNCSLC